MTFGNMNHISKAVAAVSAQWHSPAAHLADALRAMDSLRPQFDAMAAINETLRGIQHDSADALRSMVQQIDFGRSLAAQVAEAIRPAHDLSRIVAESMRPLQEMVRARETMLEACLRPLKEAARLREQVLEQALRPLQEIQRTHQQMVSEALRPIREAAHSRQNLLQDILEPLREDLARLAASLQDYSPDITVDGDTLIVNGETYGPDDISRIEQEYVYGRAGLLVKSPAQLAWERIPPATRWVIQAILSALIGMILQCLFFGVPDKTPAQIVHERKIEVRMLTSQAAPQDIRPFVNTEILTVHIAPRRQSAAVAQLAYPQQVTVLAYRKKKRWILIEWSDSFGNTQSGWVLGRYIFRPPGRREAANE